MKSETCESELLIATAGDDERRNASTMKIATAQFENSLLIPHTTT
jgi:hypothetical protein